MTRDFPTLRFKATLRPSQSEVVKIARQQLAQGENRLHIVAPPGSGKTITGLYLWAEHIRRPALVLSPNSAIQAQWTARLDLFDCPGGFHSCVSADPETPGLFTSLTYQSVTLPRRGGQDLDADATEVWINRLIEKGQAKDPDEALIWIEDLKRHNRAYYEDRLSGYRKVVRDAVAIGGEAMQTLHASALGTLERLKQAKIGLIILDECHHLMSHWGRVLADAHRYFDHPIILGLTATPPERNGRPAEDLKRYDDFFGPLDFHVPIPAVVKDGFLAPYQDLVQFVRPTPEELDFISDANKQLNALVEELCAKQEGRESLTEWLTRVLTELRLPVGKANDWATFEKRDPEMAYAGPAFLKWRQVFNVPEFVRHVENVPPQSGSAPMPILIPVLSRYIRHRLRASPEPADQELAEKAIARLRLLGVQVTETGTQACASPIGRVMAYARGKAQALLPILKAEHKALGDRIRAVIVTDFEKTSAVTTEVSHLLNEEAGGAIAAYRVLLSDPETDALDPVLVTGSTLLVDDDVAEKFKAATMEWLAQRRFDVELTLTHEAGFTVFNGKGGDWCPRVYVALVTELFQRGLTKCLVGTRGLLGEGWDASKVNVLVDLTTVTTSTSVNQLRGRSMRLDPDDPEKLADNWDVVCVAPEFVKGLDDYYRFLEKHNTLFGLTDDGVVEKGAGHVHAAFTEIEPEGIEDSMAVLNAEMLERPARRAAFRKLWRIGEPYGAAPVHALEVRPSGGMQGGFPPFGRTQAAWTTTSLTLAIAQAVLGALREAKLVGASGRLHVGERAGGYVSAFLEDATDDDGRLFREALQEAMGPLDSPRYVIPRHVEFREDTWLSRVLPRIVGKYFQRSLRRMQMLHAVPSPLAKNKDLAAAYSRHWNTHVSPGEAVYAQAEEGKQLIDKAKRERTLPVQGTNAKEVFR